MDGSFFVLDPMATDKESVRIDTVGGTGDEGAVRITVQLLRWMLNCATMRFYQRFI